MTKDEAIQNMLNAKKVSIPYMQKALKISYERAKKICDTVIIKKENVYLDRMNEYLRKLNG
jgi:DNA segregation ATPase FtsK/SpoIIIE-like protein